MLVRRRSSPPGEDLQRLKPLGLERKPIAATPKAETRPRPRRWTGSRSRGARPGRASATFAASGAVAEISTTLPRLRPKPQGSWVRESMGSVTATVVELFRVTHRNGDSGASMPCTRERPTLGQFFGSGSWTGQSCEVAGSKSAPFGQIRVWTSGSIRTWLKRDGLRWGPSSSPSNTGPVPPGRKGASARVYRDRPTRRFVAAECVEVVSK